MQSWPDTKDGNVPATTLSWQQIVIQAKANTLGLRPPARWQALPTETIRSCFIVLDNCRRYALLYQRIWTHICRQAPRTSGKDASIPLHQLCSKQFLIAKLQISPFQKFSMLGALLPVQQSTKPGNEDSSMLMAMTLRPQTSQCRASVDRALARPVDGFPTKSF